VRNQIVFKAENFQEKPIERSPRDEEVGGEVVSLLFSRRCGLQQLHPFNRQRLLTSINISTKLLAEVLGLLKTNNQTQAWRARCLEHGTCSHHLSVAAWLGTVKTPEHS